MKYKIFTLFLLTFLVSSLSAQDLSISGYIRDAASGEALIGATLFAPDLERGTTTNEYGFYSLTFPATDTLNLVISFIGYTPQAKKLVLKESTKLDFDLDQGSYLEEVTVSANRTEDNVKKAQVGVINVPIQKIKQLPVIAGERDVFKVLQFLPGVQQAQEGTSGFLVRGGSIDQNLVQLDEAVVYNPNHLFGLFSTFNINALNNVQLIKGGFSPKYGGRLSSIVDMTMREGNKQTFEYEGGIGLLSANMTVEGPIKKDKASFIVSGRRSYLDLILAPFTPKDKKGTTYKFYDLNAKVNVELGKKDKLYLSGFSGSDNAAYTGANSINYGIDFGNQTGTLRWNHLFGNKLFSNTSFIVNNYHLSLGTTQGNYYAVLYTGIDDVNFKTDFTYIPNFKHTVKAGASYFYHTLYPASFSAKVPKKGNRISITKDSIPQR
ncbi:MAG: TonB-dependent receptor, partial [Saprospiraceae bacterium]|nr:TonB-dependent receptor [Saprospiraceae bacterium]